ncbi:MAG: hypothetical protein IJ083_00265 [Clostridia bacterium]|nr:hypothetical protein [Clostridia bacterium]
MTSHPPVSLQLRETATPVSPLLFGHFIEFAENCIDGGICDPKSPASDEHGIRQDVLALAKNLRPTILRFPGGTFANIYHWMDGVGPMDARRRRKNLIWGGITDNRFGTAEFISYCRALGAEPMLCVNMASGTAQEAAEWVEYCNGEAGTHYADLRAAHGYPEPFRVRYWCIGNESYAEPDLGAQHDPDRYISDAWEFTKHMKLMDPTLKLIFVGNSEDPAWNRKILEALSPVCDYISFHHYSGEGSRGTYGPFLSLMEFRENLVSLISTVRDGSHRSVPFNPWYRFPRRAEDIRLAIDEWNIWNPMPSGDNNRYGLRTVYTWRDALWTACMMNTLLRHAQDIGIANLAQMVNVLSPIMTDGDRAYVQPTYHVLKLYRDHMEGMLMECTSDSPVIHTASGDVPMLDAAACRHPGGTLRLFLVSLSKEDPLMISLPEAFRLRECTLLQAPDFDAFNTPGRDVVSTTQGSVSGGDIILPPAAVCAAVLEDA